MGRRCGCIGDECLCGIIPGRGLTFSGTGDKVNPLILTTNRDAHAYVQGRSTSNTDVNLTGSGVADDPYLLSVDFNIPDPAPLQEWSWTTPGYYYWTRPTGKSLFDVTVLGGGAGGWPGQTVGGVYLSGEGGRGGAMTRQRIVLPNECTRAVIAVGNGGGVQTYENNFSQYGSPSQMGFYNDDYTVTYAFLLAQGGGPFAVTGGTYAGQGGYAWNATIPVHNMPSGAAGGGGGAGTGDDRYGRDGGYHAFSIQKQAMAGGSGGDSRNLSGVGVLYHGGQGGRGSGGGGGGAGNESFTPGSGGAGGDGAVWMTCIG